MNCPVHGLTAVRAVVFDVYGTLLRIHRPRRPYRRLLDEARGRSLVVDRLQCARDIMCREVGLAEAASRMELRLPPARMRELERDLDEEIASVALFPEVPQVLRRLRAAGCRVGVCSNLAAPYVAPAECLLQGMVDAAVWSCRVGMIKPDHGIYELAALRLGVAPGELLMVGDSLDADVRGPRACGVRALHLDRRSGRGDVTSLDALPELLGMPA
ncbi:HAD family hydrolase [Coralloluteibacterium stylophorae]|uniref:HAD family hydrolase n=1 Tax=Coralloluteibacterium stylophorae TaxID=1776034 RepID=A0A8J7VYW2_9GAMM|nr:HAD family hydrolase [Coralloluteibacterium stylophorae]MBS7458664.1 HAD family hydrolase [Coralloluteibacterium stylophorae]